MLGIVTHHGVAHAAATRAGADVHTLIPNLGGFWFGINGGSLCDPEPVDTLLEDDERPAVE